MANDYLKYKWRLWFRAIDAKREGKIHMEDKREEGERFLETSLLDERQRTRVQEYLNRMYSDYVFRGKHGHLTEQEFVDMHDRDFKANSHAFIDKMRTCGDLIYGIYDVNGKGALTEEEFITAVTIGSNEHVEQVKAIFHSYNPFGGEISIRVLTEAWVHFSTSEDSSKLDIIKLGLESAVGI